MSQIKIQDLLPLLRPGFVAMDKNGEWFWYEDKPYPDADYDSWSLNPYKLSEYLALDAFNIAGLEGDWKNSLTKCGEKQ